MHFFCGNAYENHCNRWKIDDTQGYPEIDCNPNEILVKLIQIHTKAFRNVGTSDEVLRRSREVQEILGKPL